MHRTGVLSDFLPIEQHLVAAAFHRRVQPVTVRRNPQPRHTQPLPFLRELQLSAPHRMAARHPLLCHDPATAREPEAPLQMPLRLRTRRKVLTAFRHLDDAFLALALLATGCRHGDTHGFRRFK